MAAPFRVLHVLGSSQHDGRSIASIVAASAEAVSRSRYSLHALFLGGPGPLVGELEAAGVQAAGIAWSRGARDPRGAWTFWRRVRSGRYSIIHQHYGGRSVRWLARMAAPTKTVVHVHGVVDEATGERAEICVSGADTVIAASLAVASQVVGARPRVVYAGVHAREPVAMPARQTFVIGTACRFVPVKGLPFLLEAFALLRQAVPRVRLEIAGTGPLEQALRDHAAVLGISDAVAFAGWQDDLGAFFRRCDVFVLPSAHEGLGVAALEAMAAGLPVVATARGGIPELVADGQTGWLVPYDDPRALADRLGRLAGDRTLGQAMGNAGRQRAREYFSVARMAEAFTSVYDELLAAATPRAG